MIMITLDAVFLRSWSAVEGLGSLGSWFGKLDGTGSGMVDACKAEVIFSQLPTAAGLSLTKSHRCSVSLLLPWCRQLVEDGWPNGDACLTAEGISRLAKVCFCIQVNYRVAG